MPVRDKHGKLITSEQQIQERQNEHFEEVLNRPEPTEIAEIPEAETDLAMNTEIPSNIEIIKAIMSLINNKASGNDQLSAEIYI